MDKEIERQNTAGYLKTPEQAELIESEAFNDGYQASIDDATSGYMANSGIYNSTQVTEFIAVYKNALYTAIADTKGIYKLGESDLINARLFNKITKYADQIFGQIVKKTK